MTQEPWGQNPQPQPGTKWGQPQPQARAYPVPPQQAAQPAPQVGQVSQPSGVAQPQVEQTTLRPAAQQPGFGQAPQGQWGQAPQPPWGPAPQAQFGGQWGAQHQPPAWGSQPWGGGQQWGNHTPAPAPAPWGQQTTGGLQPASPWGQAPSPYPPPAPQKQKNPLAAVLVGLIVATLVVGALLGALVWLRGGNGGNQPAGPYVNESYTPPPADKNPPPLPEPASDAEAKDMRENNKLYDQAVPKPVRCSLPDVDMEAASKSELETHLNALVECLMGEWHTPMEQAGFQLPRPSVTVYETSVSTACGKMPMKNAAYCSADQQIYYAKNLATVIPSSLKSSRWMAESVIAHEFGHAIQGRQGVLTAFYYTGEKATSKTEVNALSRRIEVQADCYAGAFLGSVAASAKLTDNDYSQLGKLFYSIGDDQLSGNPDIDSGHGAGRNRKAWYEDGKGATKFSTCNTWTASADRTR